MNPLHKYLFVDLFVEMRGQHLGLGRCGAPGRDFIEVLLIIMMIIACALVFLLIFLLYEGLGH